MKSCGWSSGSRDHHFSSSADKAPQLRQSLTRLADFFSCTSHIFAIALIFHDSSNYQPYISAFTSYLLSICGRRNIFERNHHIKSEPAKHVVGWSWLGPGGPRIAVEEHLHFRRCPLSVVSELPDDLLVLTYCSCILGSGIVCFRRSLRGWVARWSTEKDPYYTVHLNCCFFPSLFIASDFVIFTIAFTALVHISLLVTDSTLELRMSTFELGRNCWDLHSRSHIPFVFGFTFTSVSFEGTEWSSKSIILRVIDQGTALGTTCALLCRRFVKRWLLSVPTTISSAR